MCSNSGAKLIGFGAQQSQLTAERQVHIGAGVMGALGAGAEQRGAMDFWMQAQHRAHQLQFGGLQGGLIQPTASCWRNACSCSSWGR